VRYCNNFVSIVALCVMVVCVCLLIFLKFQSIRKYNWPSSHSCITEWNKNHMKCWWPPKKPSLVSILVHRFVRKRLKCQKQTDTHYHDTEGDNGYKVITIPHMDFSLGTFHMIFVSFGNTRMAAWSVIFSDWLKFQKYSSQLPDVRWIVILLEWSLRHFFCGSKIPNQAKNENFVKQKNLNLLRKPFLYFHMVLCSAIVHIFYLKQTFSKGSRKKHSIQVCIQMILWL
jgi:hypothetical protein